MAEKRKLEFFLLRYVPDAVKGEFVNIGLVAIEHVAEGMTVADVRFTKDRSRLLCLDPQVDLDVLASLEKEIRGEVGSIREKAALLHRMEDSFSGVVQISPVMPAVTEKVAAIEIDEVAKLFLETRRERRTREPAGRQRILQTMRDEFENAGVLALLAAVPVEPYTKAGDPFEFDFGYRFGSEIKLFHAVSMRASVDAAVLLAVRYPRIVPAMTSITEAAPMLTAVVEPDLDRSRPEVSFAWDMMEESKIRVEAMTNMREIAQSAKRELGA